MVKEIDIVLWLYLRLEACLKNSSIYHKQMIKVLWNLIAIFSWTEKVPMGIFLALEMIIIKWL